MKQNYIKHLFFVKTCAIWLLLCTLGLPANAQLFYNIGNGADGSYTAAANTTLPGGTYNFTDFTINAGVTVTVTGPNPLIIRSTGNITINGILEANGGAGSNGVTYSAAGIGGTGVAGGYNGGNGSFSSISGPLDGSDGNGPGGIGNKGTAWSGGGGGGYANNGGTAGPGVGLGGPSNGNIMVTNLPGGSGGGGGSGGFDCGAGGGGAGGGMIAMNSGTTISIGPGGMIATNGGAGGSDGTGNCGGGAGGSGGTIWLAAPNFMHLGVLSSVGGAGGASAIAGVPYYGLGAAGSEGRIRVDYDGPIVLTGSNLPAIGYHTNIGGIPLPVALKQFNGNVVGAVNTLQWISAEETNNHHYVLQHSKDGITFSTLATLASQAKEGNSSEPLTYAFTHENPLAGHNYYRLVQVDIDGQSSAFADVIDVMRTQDINELTVYPNPVRESMNIILYLNASSDLNVDLTELSGRTVWSQRTTGNKGILETSFNISDVAAGVYLLKIYNEEGIQMIRKIQKL